MRYFAVVFTVVEYTVHQADSAEHLADNAALYISGGIVAVDRVIGNPHLVPLANPVYDITMRVLKRLGWQTEVVSAHGYQFVDIGPNNLMNNPYRSMDRGSIPARSAWFRHAAYRLHRWTCLPSCATPRQGVSLFYAVYFPAIFFSPFSDLTTTLFGYHLLCLCRGWCIIFRFTREV